MTKTRRWRSYIYVVANENGGYSLMMVRSRRIGYSEYNDRATNILLSALWG